MTRLRSLLPFTALALTGGCATIVNGGGQVISVNTDPMGASCLLKRNGSRIGAISPTPGTFAVDKSRKTIVVTCEKPGYQPVMASNVAHSTFTVLGNIVFGWLIGVIVDELTGADYEYASTMNVDLPPTASAPNRYLAPTASSEFGPRTAARYE